MSLPRSVPLFMALLVALAPACRAEHAARSSDTPVSASAKAWPSPPAELPSENGQMALRDRRPLLGAGAVAFDPRHPRLVWADGEKFQVLDLDGNAPSEHAAGGWVSDLGYAVNGDLWVIAGHASRWRDGARACSSDVELDRLLAVDDAGIDAAADTYSDGVGPVTHRVRLDANCRLEREIYEPLSDTKAATSKGEAPLSARALPPGLPWKVEARRVTVSGKPAVGLPSVPVAVSPDGRWWVFEEEGQRVLWRLREPR